MSLGLSNARFDHSLARLDVAHLRWNFLFYLTKQVFPRLRVGLVFAQHQNLRVGLVLVSNRCAVSTSELDSLNNKKARMPK